MRDVQVVLQQRRIEHYLRAKFWNCSITSVVSPVARILLTFLQTTVASTMFQMWHITLTLHAFSLFSHQEMEGVVMLLQ